MPRLSIRAKLMFILSIFAVLFGAFHLLYYPSRVERQIHSISAASVREVAEAVSYALSPAVTHGNTRDVTRVLQNMQNIPVLRFSALYGSQGQVLESTSTTPEWALGEAGQGRVLRTFIRSQDNMLVVVAPVFYEEPRDQEVGTLVLGFAMEGTQKVIRETRQIGLLVGLTTLLFGLGLAFFAARRYIQPVMDLTAAAQQVAQGDLEPTPVHATTGDEVQELCDAFAVMTDRLRVGRDEIERQNRLLEYRVQDRTKQLMDTIWELEDIRAGLEARVRERTRSLEDSREELKAWAATLEDKVAEKTQELHGLNAHLLDSYQKLMEVDRLKGEFLANMSHELRTPLNSIIGFSGMLMQDPEGHLNQETREDLRIIYQNGKSLLGLIDQILDLSKIEAGRMELSLELVEVGPLLDEVRAMAEGLLKGRSLELSYSGAPTPLWVRADRERLRQVFTNLMGNAVKFTETGGVSIRTEVAEDRLRVHFEDTGIGMTEAEVERLFRPFQQVDGSITRRFGGTGLGLAISQRFMGMMEGRITATSQKGVGSTFTVDLPLAPEHP